MGLPLQGPQLLEANPPRRPIQEQGVDTLVVAVQANAPHPGETKIDPQRRRRIVGFTRNDGTGTVKKHRNILSSLNVNHTKRPLPPQVERQRGKLAGK